MSKAYNIPIKIQIKDDKTEKWVDYATVHARIVKNKGSEYYEAGAIQSQAERTFEFRYSEKLRVIEFNTSLYRIIYNNVNYNIIDYDDYMNQHINIKLEGLSYGQ